MENLPLLPVALDQLPAMLQRFCNPQGPLPARMMAAKGMVPVKGNDQVTMLAQLSADAEEQVRTTALETLLKLPEGVLQTACDGPLMPAVLHCLARTVKTDDLLGRLAANNATHDGTVEQIARACSELLAERIAVNEKRLLNAPTIIEALYKNRNTRMSTADRLIELAARNNVVLHGIPSFQAAVEAVQGQLIPEPSDELLPQDAAFATSLAEDKDENAFQDDKVAGLEEVKQQYKPLSMQILDMSKSEKLRLALVGNMAARAILVRDHSKQVAMAAVQSPQLTVGEAADIARSKEVSEDILRFIGNKKEWIKSSEVKHNLCFNPKTPVGISMRFVSHLRMEELKALGRNRNIPGQVKSMANQWVARKEKKEG
ncbi:MAG: hypothetical protein RL701_3385 [Pseudomonadota bacterium]|jgi:hypothetical protein